MKRTIKRLLTLVLLLPIGYLLIALLLTYLTVNDEVNEPIAEETIYLKSNGIHLDIVVPSSCITAITIESKYVAVGWGDKDFYLNTPRFSDLTFSTAVKALFLKSESLLHLTAYNEIKNNWGKVPISKKQLERISSQLNQQFNFSNLAPIEGYHSTDFFYQAKGSYSCLFTCNTWVNSIFKNANLKASSWTPFSFRLLELYR